VAKAKGRPELAAWPKAGGRFAVWGWRKVGTRWRVKIVEIQPGHLASAVVTAPARRRSRRPVQPVLPGFA
jgi:hypothetical protein